LTQPATSMPIATDVDEDERRKPYRKHLPRDILRTYLALRGTRRATIKQQPKVRPLSRSTVPVYLRYTGRSSEPQ
jgi:hypothetical protein